MGAFDGDIVIRLGEALPERRERAGRGAEDRELDDFETLAEILEALCTCVRSWADDPDTFPDDLVATIDGLGSLPGLDYLVAILTLACEDLWKGRQQTVFDTVMGALEGRDDVRRRVCRLVVDGDLPGRDRVAAGVAASLGDDRDARLDAQVEVMGLMLREMRRFRYSEAFARHALRWLARLDDDPAAVVDEVVEDLRDARGRATDRRPEALWLGVLDAVDEAGTTLPPGVVDRTLEGSVDCSRARVRRRGYKLGARLRGAAFVEPGLDDPDRSVRRTCNDLLEHGQQQELFGG